MATTLCTTCNKCPPGLKGCGIHAILENAEKHGASVAVGYVDGKDVLTVLCTEYRKSKG